MIGDPRCQQPAPFQTADGPFLEVNHVRLPAEHGSDSIGNAVAICPNCHRALHYSLDARQLIEKLYGSVARLKRPESTHEQSLLSV